MMLMFAILFFAIMYDAGLFEPLIRRVVASVGNDPLRVTVGTALLSSAISLDGDGSTYAHSAPGWWPIIRCGPG